MRFLRVTLDGARQVFKRDPASADPPKRWRGSCVAIAVGLICALSGAAVVTAEELFTPSDAAQSLASADPTAVGADPSQQAEGAPSVQEQGAGFEVESASVDATIPKDADNPIAVETSSGELKIEPQGVSARASTGEAVNDGAAVVYANTGKDSDTSVVPLEKGIETFTNIRSEDAGEDFSMKVDLPGDEEVKRVDDDTIAVIDPTPDLPGDQDLPKSAEPGSARADAARASSGSEARNPNSSAPAEAGAAASNAGTEKPADVNPDDVKNIDVPADEAAARLEQAPTDTPAPGSPVRRDSRGARCHRRRRRQEDGGGECCSDGAGRRGRGTAIE